MLKGKKILLGISGGIAAYKTPELARLLMKQGGNLYTSKFVKISRHGIAFFRIKYIFSTFTLQI
jgi:hypothetical protein